MAVDPDHFRRGFGAMLCRYSIDIAAKDNVPIGVIAAETGMKLYASLGYSTDVKVTLTDGRENKEASVDFWVQKWGPHGI
ncbi:hypothetical protein B0O99DRAFT_628204 [Bisporella sp. PMI_857]|nr:hypothetical protein B0O99DRAFT_628204 [Bisporella sp. PMI_857]